jgi:HEAT repeat protein
MVRKTVAGGVAIGAVAVLVSGLSLPVQSLGQQRPESPPSALVAEQASPSRGNNGCASSASNAGKPAEARAASWACLLEGASNKKSDHRTQAVYALGTLGAQPDTVSLIEARLRDTDSFVRQAAAKTLGDMQVRESVPKLHAALDDKSAAVSFTAAQALWRIGDKSGTSILAQVLAGERGVSPGLIHTEWHDMHEQLHNPTSIAEFGAVQAAGAFLGPAAFGVAALEELAKDKTAGVRAISAGMLGDGTDPGDRVLLEEALKDKSWLVRAAAAQALGHAGDQSDIEKLMPMMDDNHPAVRYKAAAAIVRLTTTVSTQPGQ